MINNSKTHIAFLGPKGSYSHIAAMKYASYCYSNCIIEYSCKKFSDILILLEHHQAEYGVLPIENSSSGLIDEVCNLLLTTSLILVRDITIPIKHCILVNNYTVSLKEIQIIYSHPQPIQQCSKFLKNFSKWKVRFCESSAVAIKTVALLNQSNIAALGSIQGGTFYGLQPLLLPNTISNHQINKTRFIILKNEKLFIVNESTPKKIMLIISINHKPENIFLILNILRYYNIKINFLKLNTLLNDKFKKMIILEIIANLNHKCTQQALTSLRNISYSLKILGYYTSIDI